MEKIDRAIEKAFRIIFGPRRPRISILICTTGRSGLDTAVRALRRGSSQGILILVGDPKTSPRKLVDYHLIPIYESIVRRAISNFVVVLVDNGLRQFALKGGKYELVEAREPEEKGDLVNDSLLDNPVIIYAAHAMSRGLSLSHVEQFNGVYVMSKAIEAECPRDVNDFELIAGFLNKLRNELTITASFIDNPARRKIILFWYGFNVSEPDNIEGALRDFLMGVFDVNDLYIIGGANKAPENPPPLFKPKCDFDTKYLVAVLLFGVDFKRDKIGPQFDVVRRVWEEWASR